MNFATPQELLDFINDQLDGSGLIVTDDDLILEAIERYQSIAAKL